MIYYDLYHPKVEVFSSPTTVSGFPGVGE